MEERKKKYAPRPSLEGLLNGNQILWLEEIPLNRPHVLIVVDLKASSPFAFVPDRYRPGMLAMKDLPTNGQVFQVSLPGGDTSHLRQMSIGDGSGCNGRIVQSTLKRLASNFIGLVFVPVEKVLVNGDKKEKDVETDDTQVIANNGKATAQPAAWSGRPLWGKKDYSTS